MHSTKNSLPLATRKKIVSVLAPLLADSSDLYSQCKQAHWNVRGAGFMALHELFDKLSAEVDATTDIIAERILQLGSPASGTVRSVAKQSRLKEYTLAIGTCEQHAEALSSALMAFNAELHQSIDETGIIGDSVTADMLTAIARGLDKQLWFVEAHLPINTSKGQLLLSSVKV